jgi:hypothetical protein
MKWIINNISAWFIAAYTVLLIGNFKDWWFMDWFAILFIPLGLIVALALLAFIILIVIGKIHIKRNKHNPKPTYNRGTNHNPNP